MSRNAYSYNGYSSSRYGRDYDPFGRSSRYGYGRSSYDSPVGGYYSSRSTYGGYVGSIYRGRAYSGGYDSSYDPYPQGNLNSWRGERGPVNLGSSNRSSSTFDPYVSAGVSRGGRPEYTYNSGGTYRGSRGESRYDDFRGSRRYYDHSSNNPFRSVFLGSNRGYGGNDPNSYGSSRMSSRYNTSCAADREASRGGWSGGQFVGNPFYYMSGGLGRRK
jgi:hypothetical protein